MLSKLKKLLERIRNNPKTVRFEELDKILIKEGFNRRQSKKGTSHFYYTKGNKTLSVPFNKPYILECYVKDMLELISDEEREV